MQYITILVYIILYILVSLSKHVDPVQRDRNENKKAKQTDRVDSDSGAVKCQKQQQLYTVMGNNYSRWDKKEHQNHLFVDKY